MSNTIGRLIRLGHPTLRRKALPFTREEIIQPETQHYVKRLQTVLRENGGIGLAAPQINFSKRLITVNFQETEQIKALDLVLFNPEIIREGNDLFAMWEGCLSLPTLMGKVTRKKHVQVKFLNEKGEEKKIEASGVLSVALQHEIDHLNGILYIDRLSPENLLNNFAFDEEAINIPFLSLSSDTFCLTFFHFFLVFD
jgi:peptide deformylase